MNLKKSGFPLYLKTFVPLFAILVIVLFLFSLQIKETVSTYLFKMARGSSLSSEDYFKKIETAHKINQDNGYYSFMYARFFMANKDYQKALVISQHGLQRYSSVLAFAQIGSILWNLDKLTESKEYFKKALMLYADSEETRERLAVIAFYNKEYDKAEEHFKYLLNQNPENPNPYYFLGYILYKKHDYKSAAEFFKYLPILIGQKRHNLLFDKENFRQVSIEIKEELEK